MELDQERNLAQYNAEQQTGLEIRRSIIALGQNVVKITILINGGAAVALLSFIGNILATGQEEVLILLAKAMRLFSWGVLASAGGAATTYCSQYLYDVNFLGKNTRYYGHGFHAATILLLIVSFVLFFCGLNTAYHAFAEGLVKK